MNLGHYQESTIEKYLRSVKEFIEFTNKPIEELIEPDIINYLNEQQISSKETVNAIKASLRFFFIIILGKNISVLRGRYGRTFKEPVVLNKDEIVKRLESQREVCPKKSGTFYCIKANTMLPVCKVTSCSFYGKCNSKNAIHNSQGVRFNIQLTT